MTERLLDVDHLKVSFRTEEGVVQAVDDVSFNLDRGELVAIVGESGSGKSVTALTLLGLTRGHNTSLSGQVMLGDLDLLDASESVLQHVRGKRVAMIFQDPMTALNPVHRIGEQIVEQIRAHESITKRAANVRAIELLNRVGIPHARDRVRSYPHEFSGGMRQRVMIAMSLSCSPEVLIADEPTTALDVTIQAQILAEIDSMRHETGVGVLLITHDLGVVADVADRVVVMYAGRVVEQGSLSEIFYDPLHPYTWGLLGSVPRVDKERPGRLPTIAGNPPSLLHPPTGCHFRPRCPWSFEACSDVPALHQVDASTPGHADRCFLSISEKRTRRVVGDAIGLPVSTKSVDARERGASDSLLKVDVSTDIERTS